MSNNKEQGLAKSLTARAYFLCVCLFTVVILLAFVLSQPVLRHQMSVKLGLSEAISAKSDSFYAQRVQPIFDEYCIACHDNRKGKGDLRLDSYLFSRYSGKSGSGIVPGQLELSTIISRMKLPENDKRLMPPLGWDHPTKDEMKVLELWVKRGASHNLTEADFPEAPERIIEVKIPKLDIKDVEQKRASLSGDVAALQKRFPFALSYIARDSKQLRFTNVSLRMGFSDAEFAELSPVASEIASLYLRDASISDDSLSVLGSMTNLTEAFLNGVQISTQAMVEIVNQHPKLKLLAVDASVISPELEALCDERSIELRVANRG